MSIELEKAIEAFKSYTNNFNQADPSINLKVAHTIRVMKMSERLAKAMNLSSEQEKLAALIGLLHDIGRFEQFRLFNTFNDSKSIDHANLGVQILFGCDYVKNIGDNNALDSEALLTTEPIIRNFLDDDKYDKSIYLAVKNHNKFSIQQTNKMDEETLLQSKIIRDSDKMDIFKTVLLEDNKTLYGHENIEKDIMSEDIYRDFLKQHLCSYDLRNGGAVDALMCSIAYVYDVEFPESFDIILEDGNLDKILEQRFLHEKTNMMYIDAGKRAKKWCLDHCSTNVQ